MKDEDRLFLNTNRQEIDKIDEKILSLLIERFKVVDLIGEYKKEKNIPIFCKDRVNHIIKKVRYVAEKNNINPDFFETVYKTIIDVSCEWERAK